MAVATVLSIIFYFLPKDMVVAILSMQILISFCAGIVSPLMWSMYADIADYSEWKTGRRATGLIFFIFIYVSKAWLDNRRLFEWLAIILFRF